MRTLRISVRRLVEFLLRSGDIDSEHDWHTGIRPEARFIERCKLPAVTPTRRRFRLRAPSTIPMGCSTHTLPASTSAQMP